MPDAQCPLHEDNRSRAFDYTAFGDQELPDARWCQELNIEADCCLPAVLLDVGRQPKRGVEKRSEHSSMGKTATIAVLVGDYKAVLRALFR